MFPPLRLDPANITLVIGAKFQVSVSGGPNVPDAAMEYLVNGPKSASANADGVITGDQLPFVSQAFFYSALMHWRELQ